MSSRFLNAAGAAAIAAMLALSAQTSSAQITFPWERSQQGAPQGQAQSDDADLEMRIQRLESQLRQLTGQNEELQFRNRQLEDRLRQLGAAPPAPGGQPPHSPAWPRLRLQFSPVRRRGSRAIRNKAIRSKVRQPQGYPQAQPGYDQQPQVASPAPIVQDPAAPQAGGRRRGDAFDPSQNPNAPGAPRALGGGQMPMSSEAAAGAPGGRGAGRTAQSRRSARSRWRLAAARCSRTATARPRARRQRRADHACRPRPRRRTNSISASATCSARTMRWPKRP